MMSQLKGMFGRQLIGTPGYGDPAAAMPAPMQAPPYERPSTGQFIAGTIGDALQSWAGGRPTFAPMLQQRQQMAAEEAQYQRRAADQYANWQRQKEWERVNPAPVEPNALERNRTYLNGVEPGLGDTYSRNFANNGGGAPQLMNVPGVGVVSIPKTTAPQAPAGPPTAAIDYLRKNPGMAAQFDQKYGAGASQRFLGGAPSQGGATFP